MNKKTCSKCQLNKRMLEFSKKKGTRDGHRSNCKDCAMTYNKQYYTNTENKNRQSAYLKQYALDHKDEITEQGKIYYQKNKDKIKVLKKVYREKNKDKIQEVAKEYYAKNKDAILASHKTPEYRAAQRKSDRKRRLNPHVRLSRNFSRSIGQSLTNGSINRKSRRHWEDLVDYTLVDLKSHLEEQFKPGMSWDNYGKWEIDHIRPVSSFKIKTLNDISFKECWSLTNLQSLWRHENRAKSAKYNG